MVVDLPAYRITVERGALDRVGELARAAAPAHRYALLSDREVAPRYAGRVVDSFGDARDRVMPFVMPAGETHKTRETWARLTDEMLAAGFGRDTAVVALGGGVVGDVAGFVAATFMRGVPVVQVPTTLLAMIDASVGGKTGVDTPAGKNLVGAFHQPAAVIVDPDVLATLPPAHVRSGLAEAIKHGVIADERYFAECAASLPALLSDLAGSAPAWDRLIARSVAIKADVVAEDEREGGRRQVLNFGHTIGHAVETASGYALLHGEAVAIGMVLEARVAERLGVAEAGTSARVREAVERTGLPAELPAVRTEALAPERLLEGTRSDKKARGGVVRYALPARVGAMAGAASGWSVAVPDALVLEVLR